MTKRRRALGRRTRVLVLTREAQLGRLAQGALEPACKVRVAATIEPDCTSEAFDVVLADLESLDPDVLARLQRVWPSAGVLAICREYRESECIAALEMGADYLARPFRKDDLIARVRVAALRRFNATGHLRYYRNGSLVIDLFDQNVVFGGQPVALSPTQLKVLMTLANKPGSPVNYDGILSALGDSNSPSGRIALHSLVLQLRRRVERDPRRPQVILTEAGFGYRLAAPPAESEGRLL